LPLTLSLSPGGEGRVRGPLVKKLNAFVLVIGAYFDFACLPVGRGFGIWNFHSIGMGLFLKIL